MPIGIYKRKPRSEEIKHRISMTLKSKYASGERVNANKGKTWSEERRKLFSLKLIGKKHPHRGHKLTEETKIKIAQKIYKGELAGYSAKHKWIGTRCKASKCEICNVQNAKRYEWANISRQYKRDLSDWAQLCKSCHRIVDIHKIDIPRAILNPLILKTVIKNVGI